MLRLRILNILIYFLVKYFAFYILLMFKNNDFTFLELNNIRNGEDLFYYLWLLLFLPVVSMIIFSAPIYFSFKVKKGIYFILIIGVILIAEYFLYTYLASQMDSMNGVYNGIISLLFLFLFFFKAIRSIFMQRSISNL